MSRFIVLDSSPLGMVTNPKATPVTGGLSFNFKGVGMKFKSEIRDSQINRLLEKVQKKSYDKYLRPQTRENYWGWESRDNCQRDKGEYYV